VLTFFIAGLLLSLVPLSTSITWERTPHPLRRPAFSSHLFSSVVQKADRIEEGKTYRSGSLGFEVLINHYYFEAFFIAKTFNLGFQKQLHLGFGPDS